MSFSNFVLRFQKHTICTIVSVLCFSSAASAQSPSQGQIISPELITESYKSFQQLNYSQSVTIDPDRIQPYSNNPRYWQYKGEPILLLGASDQDNLFNHPDIWPFGLESHLDLMKVNGGNYLRNTMSSRDRGNLHPFRKLDNGLYDLNSWNPDYWDQFENFLNLTYNRNIIVQIEIWDRFDFAQYPWDHNPFNPKNNINYTTVESRLPVEIETHPGQRENPFFRSVPELENNPIILVYQRAFVEKILSISLNYPHVLYCISNETNESPKWSDYWANFVIKQAMENDVLVHVTEMWDAWDLSDPEHNATFDKPDLYTFVDISQNNHQHGQDNWDNAQMVRMNRLTEIPRPMNSVKIYSGMRYGGNIEEGTRKLWRNIIGGFASSRFHRTGDPFLPHGIGLSPLAQTHIRSMRMFTDAMNIFKAEPANHLLSNREVDSAYAIAEAGQQYAIYFPGGSSVSIDLSASNNLFYVRWLDIMNSEWSETTTIEGGSISEITPPNQRQWAVLLLAVDYH